MSTGSHTRRRGIRRGNAPRDERVPAFRARRSGLAGGMNGRRAKTEAKALAGAHFRYFDFVMAAFVTILLLSNVIGAGKIATMTLPRIGPWPFGAGILFFPISYVIGDVLTEV